MPMEMDMVALSSLALFILSLICSLVCAVFSSSFQ